MNEGYSGPDTVSELCVCEVLLSMNCLILQERALFTQDIYAKKLTHTNTKAHTSVFVQVWEIRGFRQKSY